MGETIFILRNKAAFFSLKTNNVEQIPLFRVQMATGLVSFFPKVVSLPFLVREKSKWEIILQSHSWTEVLKEPKR